MKKALLLLVCISIISYNQKSKENKKANIKEPAEVEKTTNFNWLLGKWKRFNEEEGKETFENWRKITDKEYAGIGFTMQNGDTIKQEKMRLLYRNSNWDLMVKVPDESQFITFKGTSFTKTEFTCENKELDFPNKIKYWKNGNKLNAMVSGGELKIAFEFEKLK